MLAFDDLHSDIPIRISAIFIRRIIDDDASRARRKERTAEFNGLYGDDSCPER